MSDSSTDMQACKAALTSKDHASNGCMPLQISVVVVDTVHC